MFPMPATNRWSMSSGFSRAARPANARPSAPTDHFGDSGSGPMWASAATGAGATNNSPNVRGSTKRSSRPSDRDRMAWVWRAAGQDGAVSSSWPDIRKWMTSVSTPSSSGTNRNLPIRPAGPSRAPRSRWTSSSAGWRRTVRTPVTTTAVTSRPATSRSSPRRTTSTSGSSGTFLVSVAGRRGGGGGLGRLGGPAGLGGGDRRFRLPQPLPGHPGGGLLRLLLGAPLAPAPGRPLEDDVGVEPLGMVRPLVAHLVAGHLVEAAGGELLEPGLVVLPAGAFGGGGDPLAEQAHHELVGGVPPAVEIGGGQHRLHGVGQDRGLLPAAGQTLALAEEHERAELDLGGQLGEDAGVDHRRPHLGQLALREVREGAVDVVGDDQAEDGVAQELQPLVRLERRVLGAERPVGQGAGQQLPVLEGSPQQILQPVERAVGQRLAGSLSPPARRRSPPRRGRCAPRPGPRAPARSPRPAR